jgi:hypothetical protein
VFILAVLGIFLWKLGPWNHRQRILSFKIPEGWQLMIKETISNYSSLNPIVQKKIERGLQVLMAEKQWQSSSRTEVIYDLRLKALVIGSWVGAQSNDPYYKDIENIEMGLLSGHYTLSIQYDSKGIYSEKWYQPELLEQLGIQGFSYKYRGIIAEWAAHLHYQQNLFKQSIDNLQFDLTLFPLFFEIYLTDKSILSANNSGLVDFYDHFLKP